MKKITTTTLLFFSLISGLIAQNLENKIPNDVDIIITSNAENLFDLITISDIDSNFLGEMILKDVNRGKDEQITSIEDLGVDVKSNAYFFTKHLNDKGFLSVFVELKNRKQFEANFSESKLEKIEKEKGYSYVKGYRNITIWNDNYLLMIKGKVSSLEENGFKTIKDYAFTVLENKISTSISINKKFQKAKKKNSVATVWVRDYGNLMTEFAYSLEKSVFSSLGFEGEDIIGVNEMTANLYFEKDNFHLKVDTSVDDELKDVMKKMYHKKMSTDLLKHLDSEALAFFSLAMNTEEVLLQYPKLVNNTYVKMLPKMAKEIEFGTDLFSLIIDEKAIGELVTGDALLVLNDLSKKEVEYTTYEYDEDYNRKEVVGTKEEMVPDITFMLGTKEEGLLNKLFGLGEKYKVLEANKNIYRFTEMPGVIPVNIYVFVKDNVLFFTTSKERALNIYNTTKSYKASEYSKMIKSNSLVIYNDVHKLMGQLSGLFLSGSEKEIFDFGSKNFKSVYLKVSKVKGNTISSELRVNTNENKENSLKLLLSFFDYMK